MSTHLMCKYYVRRVNDTCLHTWCASIVAPFVNVRLFDGYGVSRFGWGLCLPVHWQNHIASLKGFTAWYALCVISLSFDDGLNHAEMSTYSAPYLLCKYQGEGTTVLRLSRVLARDCDLSGLLPWLYGVRSALVYLHYVHKRVQVWHRVHSPRICEAARSVLWSFLGGEI